MVDKKILIFLGLGLAALIIIPLIKAKPKVGAEITKTEFIKP